MSDTTSDVASASPNVIDHLTGPSRFGTQTRLAEAAGVKQNTISDKKKSNSLTHEQMRRILRRGPEMGVPVVPADFFPELSSDAAADHREAAA